MRRVCIKKVVQKMTDDKGLKNSPVLVKNDGLLYTANSIVQYCEQNGLPSKKMLPADVAKKKEVLDLYNLFNGQYEDVVTKYVYDRLLSKASYAKPVFTKQVPFGEKLAYAIKFRLYCKPIKKG